MGEGDDLIQPQAGSDQIAGGSGPNRLIGGGGIDAIEGKGGIDLLDAKDGEADLAINCGPGKNSKEKAKFDQGLDPAPLSC